MARSNISFIFNDRLILYDDMGKPAEPVIVDSATWYAWLKDEQNRSFLFKTPQGTITIRRERKRNSWYWYAYRKRERKLRKAYLGKAEELNLTRLNKAAAQLFSHDAAADALMPAHEHENKALMREETQAQTNGTGEAYFREPPLAPPSEYGSLTSQNLPAQLVSPVGRDKEIGEIRALLRKSGVRLVTLTGPGGIGKTCLGLSVAMALLDDFIDGVYFVSLAAISDPLLVIATIARTLGIEEAEGIPALTLLKGTLRSRHMLLLLDNFEQVITSAPDLLELLSTCPRITMLITSRTVLHVNGEYDFPVLPLALPDLTHLPECDALSQYAAVALLLLRAKAIKPDFRLTAMNAHAIAEICVRLDGLPLAIELATARLKLLPPQELLAKLTNRLRILTSGARDLPDRQQTLRNTIAWSYNLLDAAEQQLFQRLSIFVGGCTLQSLVALCNALTGEDEEIRVMDAASSLIDKSMLQLIEQEGYAPRLRMLETLREYGLECLAAGGEFEATRHAHAAHYLSMVEEIEPRLLELEQAVWLEHLEQEHDNLRAALQWTLEQGVAGQEMALRLCGALPRFWDMRGHRSEGWNFLMRALAFQADVAEPVRAKALDAAAMLAINQSEHDLAVKMSEENLALCRKFGDSRGVALSLHRLGGIAWARGSYFMARSMEEEALSLFKKLNDRWGIASSLEVLASVALDQCVYTRAQELVDECLALWNELGNKWGIAYALWLSACIALYSQADLVRSHALLEESVALSRSVGYKGSVGYALITLGFVNFFQGEIAQARSLFEESIALFHEVRDRRGIALGYYSMGWFAFSQGDYVTARTLYEQGLNLLNVLGHQWMIALCLEGLASVVVAQGQPAKAALLWGLAEHLRQVMGAPLPPVLLIFYEQTVLAARTQVDEATFATLWAEGRRMTLQQVMAAQRSSMNPTITSSLLSPHVPTTLPATYPDKLTAREVQVLRLVAQGWTDTQIATHLVISPRTVNTHISSIYRKTQVSSRSGATRYAIQHHLI